MSKKMSNYPKTKRQRVLINPKFEDAAYVHRLEKPRKEPRAKGRFEFSAAKSAHG